MKKILTAIIILTGISINAFAGHISTKEKRGDKYFFVYSFDKAIDSYTRAKHLSVEGQRNLAASYRNTGQNNQAEIIYSKLIAASGEVLPEDYFNYAMILKTNGKYDESNKAMDTFYNLKPNDLRAKDYMANKGELENWLIYDGKYKIVRLNFNTDANDFGPAYYKDKIVFASTRAKPDLMEKTYNWTGKPFLNMYVSEVDQDQLKTPEEFGKELNGKMHDGPASFTKDGNYMAFTRNRYGLKRKDRVVNLEICFSNFKDEKWSKPEPFVLNSKEYSVGHPCLTADGNTMYFSSDMPGGFGGADIYRITKDGKGVWGKAENLGDKINTEGDEMFPFFEEKSNTMFFSSNGRFGLGGLDVFICEMQGSQVGPVYNAGVPLNTQFDDYAVIVDENMSKGYFSSNRSGGGDDIYSVDLGNEFIVKADVLILQKEEIIVLEKQGHGTDLGKILELNSVYFDLDKYNIRSDAKIGLDKVVKMMNENPEMVVEFSSHTDCRASEKYNQILSDNRAAVTHWYIKTRITNPERIYGKGYGETKLVNGCACEGDVVSGCSKEEFQKDRRTKFIIISNIKTTESDKLTFQK